MLTPISPLPQQPAAMQQSGATTAGAANLYPPPLAQDHMKRREFSAFVGLAICYPLLAHAQGRTLQVGFLYPGPQSAAPPRIAAFSSGLQSGGIRVPEQAELFTRVTDGNPTLLAPMAAELVAQRVDLILAVSSAAVTAARAATSIIPIVAIDLESDPVANGFASSHARPGGNITGVFLDFPDFGKKWLEALKEAVPDLSNVVIFWDPATTPMQRLAVEAGASMLGLKSAVVELPSPGNIEAAFTSAAKQGAL
jgi:putative ABC transport system substrate-binding protein